MHQAGTRTLIIVDGSDLYNFMESHGIRDINPDSMQSFLRSIPSASIEEYLTQRKRMWKVTVGPGDGVLLPFGAIFAEKVASSSDVSGFRVSFWLHSDVDKMEDSNKWLVGLKRPNKYLQNATEATLAAAAD